MSATGDRLHCGPPRSAAWRRWRCSATCAALPSLFAQLPIGELDACATGAEITWFREALANPNRDNAYWVARDFAASVGSVAAPEQLVGSWQDIFLPWMLEDFATLRSAGHAPQLVIGPWTHASPATLAARAAWSSASLLGRFHAAADGSVRVAFELCPIGHRFAAGHRIRLQVSSGAHPRYARNPGTREGLATTTGLQPVDIAVLHDSRHPFVLVLPAAPALE